MLISMLVSQIIPSVQGIIDNFDSYSKNFTDWVEQTLKDNPDIPKDFKNFTNVMKLLQAADVNENEF